MRSALAVPAALLLWLAASARAVTLEGSLAPHMQDAKLSGVPILLLGVQRGGDTVERETRTRRDGSFAFKALPQPAVYLVMARYAGVHFPGGRAVFDDGEADAVKTLTIPIFAKTSDPAGLAVASVSLTLSPEPGGAYRVEQTATLVNPGDRVVVRAEKAPGGPPLLALGLLEGHGELSSPFGGVPSGFALAEGALALSGPMLPGEREVTLGYDLASRSGGLESALAFPDPVEELEIFVRDTGVIVEAGSLHPARPARDADGNAYQHYLGFELPAGLRIPLVVRPLARPRSEEGRLVAALVASGVTLVLSLLVVRPVLRGRALPVPADPGPRPEREALLAALSELEHDFETGKLSSEDHDRLREALVREAVETLGKPGPASPESGA